MIHSLIDELYAWMKQPEGNHLEFKEAKNAIDHGKLTQYCCALANEGGGKLILGVSDKFPRAVVGSHACPNLEKTKADLIKRLHIRIEADEIHPDGKRVVIFHVPSRPIGMPIQLDGLYWMWRGQELVPMTPDMLKRIFEEGVPDFSAQVCRDATFKDLDANAIKCFREMWHKQSGNGSLKNTSDEQLLRDCEAIVDKGITYAALILFGTHKALGEHLAQAEVVFEYRSGYLTGPAQQRIEYRRGFFTFYDELWNTINLRNDMQHFQDGLFIWNIPTFNEKAVREAVLNAISHRDYRASGSIWVKQYPREIIISSPGGFPQGITPENILWRQDPRNRRIAEIFLKCGLVERTGQGADRIFEESIKQGKALPAFAHTDAYQVVLTLNGEIQDEQFLRFLEKVGKEILASFTTEDFLVLDYVHNERPRSQYPPELKVRLMRLVDLGIVECIGRGRGARREVFALPTVLRSYRKKWCLHQEAWAG
jgi:ATP-dependent DNA helicase RecG